MTVKELILALECLSPDLPVLVRAYEGGVNNVSELVRKQFHVNPDGEAWYYGQFEQVYEHTEANSPFDGVELIGRRYK